MHTVTVPRRRQRAILTAIGLGILMAVLSARVATADYHGTDEAEARVAVQDFAFAPAIVTITAGTSVVWEVRDDPEQHTVTPVEAGSFAGSGQLFAGDDYALRFTDPGSYDYVCSLHPFMTGTVIVEAVATTALTAAPVASVASIGSVGSAAPGPSLTEPIDGGSGTTAGVVILTLILLAGVAGAGALLWRRSTRHGGGGGPAD